MDIYMLFDEGLEILDFPREDTAKCSIEMHFEA